MKPSGLGWAGDIPDHWGVSRIALLAKLESGHTPSRQHPEYWIPSECVVPWVSLSDVSQLRSGVQDYIVKTAEKISLRGLANSSARILPAGTVVLSRTASIGFSGILAMPAATTQDFANWICGPHLLPEFLMYCFRSMMDEFERFTMGSTHKTLYMPDIKRLSIPIPPIEEQKRIVAELRILLRKLDEMVSEGEVFIDLLRERRVVSIAAATTGKTFSQGSDGVVPQQNPTPPKTRPSEPSSPQVREHAGTPQSSISKHQHFELKHISVQKFRCFSSLDLHLDPSFTLLLGSNGAGKTSALEAVVVALGGLSAAINGFPRRDITLVDVSHRVTQARGAVHWTPSWPTSVATTALLETVERSWKRELIGPDRGLSDLKEVEAHGDILTQNERIGEAVHLPLVAYYGAQRGQLLSKQDSPTKDANQRNGYVRCLDARLSGKLLLKWIARQTMFARQREERSIGLHVVESAVCECIQAQRVWFDLEQNEIYIKLNDDSIYPISSLSDGYRSVIYMVADMARRTALLNPHLGKAAAKLTEGIVLIDELELHLHPKWQRTLATDLQRTFSKLQFVATSHSPQVLSSVKKEQVRILSGHSLSPISPYVHGRDSNELLNDVFDVSPRPEATREQISKLFRLLDQEQYKDARTIYNKLLEDLGPDDSDMIKAKWSLDVESVWKKEDL